MKEAQNAVSSNKASRSKETTLLSKTSKQCDDQYLRIYKAFMTNQNHLESPEKLRKAQEENKIQKITIERLSDLDIIQEIGRGATGVVFKVRHKKNQKEKRLLTAILHVDFNMRFILIFLLIMKYLILKN